jgi:hypothetical protein
MASTFTSRLKLERQGSGENAGNWGNLVNYVFNRIDSSVRGYVDVDVAGSANVTLTSNNSTSNTDDSSTDDQVHNKVLEFTGALTGDIHVFTDAVEGEYIVFNNTSGSQTLTFAPTGGTGVVLQQGAKTLVYTDGTTMFDVMADLGDIGTTGIKDTNGNEELKFVTTASAVNEITITNSATGNRPNISVTGDDTNIGLSVSTKGTGLILFNDGAYNADATLTDGATITWDVGSSPVAKVTLGGNRTLSAPTNSASGQFISLTVIQDATGSRLLTWNSAYEFTGDTAPTLTTTASKADVFVFKYNGTVWLEVGKNLNLSIT